MAYIPVSGVASSIVINSTTINFAQFQWSCVENVIEAPAFDSTLGMRHAPGKIRGSLQCSGTVDYGYNPWSGGIKVGACVGIVITLTSGYSAAVANAIVESWTPGSDADGAAILSASFKFDGPFSDFSGSSAFSSGVVVSQGTYTFN